MDKSRELSCPQACQICGASDLHEVKDFSLLPRITSDCRSFTAGGWLFVCFACGGVQKLPDARWLKEIENIYSNYQTYYQSGGDEQIVFDRVTGTPRRRSDVIIERLVAGNQLGAKGRAIDVGCGNGATLNAMCRVLTEWSFSGYELGNESLPRLSRIPRFEKLYTGTLDAVNGRFDLVTMIHSLEHFPSPSNALMQLLPVVGNGKIFIEVSNIEENPFDILIADHLMHFSPETLSHLMYRCGFEAVTVATDWVPKEISLGARAAQNGVNHVGLGRKAEASAGDKVMARITVYADWLHRMVAGVNRQAHEKNLFGIFGTSIAGTWLASAMEDAVDFFVDEDPNRVGKKHMGKPILHPSQVPQRAKVYFALAPSLARKVATRVQSKKFELVLPPPLQLT
ncbi:MAG: class I SAM-dependent methyltransferase [Candidatus Omnitrophota bacterium]